MLSSQILIFVFISGVIVTLIAVYGLYSHLQETNSEFEEKRKSKVTYRTKEEFVGNESK